MLKIPPPSPRVLKYLQRHGLTKKYAKQTALLSQNFRHPSLNVEILQPTEHKIYSFRVDKKYRGIFLFIPEQSLIKILDVNDHYK